MIKFFRQIRQNLLMENKTSPPEQRIRAGKYLKYAIGEIVLVVIGILIALSINNWNENRKERLLEHGILKGLQFDLRFDVNDVNITLANRKSDIDDFTKALEILTTDNQATKAEFMEKFEWILTVGGVRQNKTTFNNLQSSGQISLIKNKVIVDSIINYYNTGLMSWETAMSDYTRNIIAPYLLEFDYIPHHDIIERDKRVANALNPNNNIMPGRSLEDYKNNYFIINALRQKIFNMEGLIDQYEILLKKAVNLDSIIQIELDKQ